MSAKNIALISLKVILLTIILFIVFAIASQLFLRPFAATPSSQEEGPQLAPAQQLGTLMATVLLACFLQTVALSYPILRSRWAGWRLVVTVFFVYYGTATVMGQIESAVYLRHRLPTGMLSNLFLMGAFTAAVFSPLAILILGRRKPEPPTEERNLRLVMPAGEWVLKIMATAVVYVVLYYTFGYFIAWKNPAVREYYGGTDPGNFFAQMSMVMQTTPWMIPFQVFRGMLWTALALPVVRMMKGAWWEAGLGVALLFTAPLVQLLFPNPLMPETVRMTHIVEIAPYQFIFGWFVVWLFLCFGTRKASLS